MKKKLKLKNWVKITLIAIAVGVLGILSIMQYNNAVNDCVSAGHSKSYCERGLK